MSRIFDSFKRHEADLKKYLARFFRRPQDIEDVVQETFLRAYAAETKKEIHTPKAFLFRSAKNITLNELGRKAHQLTDSHEDLSLSDVLEDTGHVAADKQLDDKRQLFVVAQAVASLSDVRQQVFILRHMDGLKVKEIAKKLDMSVSAVEKHIAAGLVDCLAHLRSHGYDPADFNAGLLRGKHRNTATAREILKGEA